MLVEIDNKVYRRIDEIEIESCNGCIADIEGESTLCEAIIDKFGHFSCNSNKNTGEVGKIYEEVDRFKSAREMWEWLLDGNKIRNSSNLYYYYITMHPDGNLYKHQDDCISRLDIFDYSSYKPYTKPEWYENIPKQGILCWVWDTEDEECIKTVRNIQEYLPDFTYRFISLSGTGYMYAQPLTKEEVLERCYER